MRAVLDTNVVVSALIWGGKPFDLLQAASAGDLTLFTSPVLVEELHGVLNRLHLAARLERRSSSTEQAIPFYGGLAAVIDPPKLIAPVSRDPDDDAVLAVAVAARADLIVSGDSDLLVHGRFVAYRL
jgi:putative PIN family toxin of toxin-antitoxin system